MSINSFSVSLLVVRERDQEIMALAKKALQGQKMAEIVILNATVIQRQQQ